jgi:hypothetical protein
VIGLTKGTAILTQNGIYFNHYFYSCSLAIKEQWFKSKATVLSEISIAYTPTNGDLIYLYQDPMIPIIAFRLLGLPDFTCGSVQEYYFKIQQIKSMRSHRISWM